MKRVVIDTNIYLNFYRLKGDQSIKMLRELIALAQKKTFQIILFEQIKNEFVRNKHSDSFYKDHILQLDTQLAVNFVAPAILKKSPYENRVKNAVEKLQKYRKEIIGEYKKRMFSSSSKVNKSVEKLFSIALRLEHDEVVLRRAQYRTLRGNPPRKNNNSFGDAIIWESILDTCIDDDLFLISGDGDYESEIEKGKLNEFLQEEWGKKSNKKIEFYSELGSFINSQSPKGKQPLTRADIKEEREELGVARVSEVSTMVDAALFSAAHAGYFAFDKKCSCCGAKLENNWQISAFPTRDKCENCRNHYSPGSTCGKCGRHFHRDTLRLQYSSLWQGDFCDQCQRIV